MVKDQVITEEYALYNGDCVEVMADLPEKSIDFSIYSPPFRGLYNYSSSERDMSNCRNKEEFFEHYEFMVAQMARVLKAGRLCYVHCMDIPKAGANVGGGLDDFPGDIVRLHQKLGFEYCARYHVWKEPLGVRNRTMVKGLAHAQIVADSTLCDVAAADYVLMFRNKGKNLVPVTHAEGLMSYAGSRIVPHDLQQWRGYQGDQIKNRYSHWIWRQYASAFWDDVRIDKVLPYRESKDPEDERHVHPLQMDVIERCVVLASNPGEVGLTPYLGVGSEAFGMCINGRKAIGAELKTSYWKQSVKNCAHTKNHQTIDEGTLFPESAPIEE